MFVIAGVTGRSVVSVRYYIFRLMFSVLSSDFLTQVKQICQAVRKNEMLM